MYIQWFIHCVFVIGLQSYKVSDLVFVYIDMCFGSSHVVCVCFCKVGQLVSSIWCTCVVMLNGVNEKSQVFLWLLKAENGKWGVNNVDKTGKTRLKQRKENVHDALLHSCQHSNLAGPRPLGPAEQPRVSDFDQEICVHKTYGNVYKTVTSSAVQIMNHMLALVSQAEPLPLSLVGCLLVWYQEYKSQPNYEDPS